MNHYVGSSLTTCSMTKGAKVATKFTTRCLTSVVGSLGGLFISDIINKNTVYKEWDSIKNNPDYTDEQKQQESDRLKNKAIVNSCLCAGIFGGLGAVVNSAVDKAIESSPSSKFNVQPYSWNSYREHDNIFN